MAKRKSPHNRSDPLHPIPPGATQRASDRTERPGGPHATDFDDRHAAGTPGGGTGYGGLGGTTYGDGDPDEMNLEAAAGSGVAENWEQLEEPDEQGGTTATPWDGTPWVGAQPTPSEPFEEEGGEASPEVGDLTVTSPAFADGQPIPQEFTADGRDLSPPLEWKGVPKGTRSLALSCDDPDAPGKTWVHWVVYDIPAEIRSLRKGLPPGVVPSLNVTQGANDFGALGYGGPAPPPGPPHHYVFRLFALDRELGLDPGATKEEVIQIMQGHVLAEGQLMGTYGR